MAKIVQVRLVEGEMVTREGRFELEVSHEIDARELAYDSTAVAALRFEKLSKSLAEAEDAGEHMLSKPNLGGRKPKGLS